MTVALGIGLATVALSLALRGHGNYSDGRLVSDFDQTVIAARLIRQGHDPYTSIGPGLAYSWGWRYYYPLTAAVLALPFSFFVLPIASAVFAGISGALLAFGLTRESYHRLPLFVSAAYFHAVWLGQWSPLITAAALLPVLGFVLPAKPTIGGAVFASRPTWLAVLSGSVLLAVSLAIQPSWPMEWIGIVRAAPHLRPPILYTGGAVLALGLLRWRQPDMRLILLLGLVPQNADVFETLPLFLVCRTVRESLILATTTTIAYCAMLTGPFRTPLDQSTQYGWMLIVGAYVPALVIVFRRTAGRVLAEPDPVRLQVRVPVVHIDRRSAIDRAEIHD